MIEYGGTGLAALYIKFSFGKDRQFFSRIIVDALVVSGFM